MTGCSSQCRYEAESCDPDCSPGPVEDNEFLCRGAFNPRHFKKDKLQPSFIPKKELAESRLSVYRESNKVAFSREAVIDQIRKTGSADQSLESVLSAEVLRIRAISAPGVTGRALCVRDECECDREGSKHPAHAHIAICEMSFPAPVDQQTDIFLQIWRDLVTLFREQRQQLSGT